MIKTIIFDFDGVLAESVDIKTKAFKRLFESEGKDIADKVEQYHLAHTGVSRFDKFRYFYKNFLMRELTEDTFKELCDRFSKLVVEEVVNASYVEGAKEFLVENKDRFTFFITSATPQQEIEEIIKKRDMGQFFKAVYGAPTKKEDAVRQILSSGGLNFLEVAYIGDALSDLKAATKNSIYFIARIYENNKAIFDNVDCIKIDNLLTLAGAVESIGN